MKGRNKGIAAAGNILVDYVKTIDVYPAQSNLCNIKSVSKSVGGLVCNTGIDLAMLDEALPVKAIGCVGNDADGAYAVARMESAGIDVSGIRRKDAAHTGFTDVMTAEGTGERTFFHSRGANALFGFEDIDFDGLDCDIFHLGYALLLDRFDAPDAVYGTVMAKTLRTAQAKGFKTSIDVVSETGGRFTRVVTPSLKYCNCVILNETESGMVSGIMPRDNLGKIIVGNIEKICLDFFGKGVSEYVIIHCPEAGFLMDADRRFTAVPSLTLPRDYIKGTVGAGDAFCAGALYSIYKGFDNQRILEVAAASAAANLSASDSVSGARRFEEIMELRERYGRSE
jgi:sugar/nucleoside kinase (ribokinase family)